MVVGLELRYPWRAMYLRCRDNSGAWPICGSGCTSARAATASAAAETPASATASSRLVVVVVPLGARARQRPLLRCGDSALTT